MQPLPSGTTQLAPVIAGSVVLHEIPAEHVAAYWADVAPLLERALRYHPFLDLRDLSAILIANYAQLILLSDAGTLLAAVVMERVCYPSRVVANVLALGGKIGVYRKYMDTIADHCEAWSRAHGCDTIAIVGRAGWQRIARKRHGNTLILAHAWKRL